MILLDELKAEMPELNNMLTEAEQALDPEGMKAKLSELDQQVLAQGFWDDQEQAQKVMKEKKTLEDRLAELDGLAGRLEYLEVMIEMAEESESGGDAEGAASCAYDLLPAGR